MILEFLVVILNFNTRKKKTKLERLKFKKLLWISDFFVYCTRTELNHPSS